MIKEALKYSRKSGILLRAVCAALCFTLFVGCSGKNDEEKETHTASPTLPPITHETQTEQESEATEQVSECPEVTESSFVDRIDISKAIPIDLGNPSYAVAVLPEEVGWLQLGHSTKSIQGEVTCVDDYKGGWVLSIKGENRAPDIIATFETYTYKEIYVCSEEYPSVSNVCRNPAGIQWIEHNSSAWRLLQIPETGGEPREIASGTIYDGILPVVSSREHYLMFLAEMNPDRETWRLRAWNIDTQNWYEKEEVMHTGQLQHPQSVEEWITWTEETSLGWAVVSRNFESGQRRVHVLSTPSQPQTASFDGEMLLALVGSGLYAVDVESGRTSIVTGVTHYQHIPRDGAIIGGMGEEQQVARFQFYKRDGVGEGVIIPLASIKDGGKVHSVFHHSYELEVEMFLIERNGTFEQTTVSLRRFP